MNALNKRGACLKMKLEAMAELASFLENLLKTLIAAYSSLGQVAYY